MQKIACVFSFKESNWVSCQKIVFNLHKSYQDCTGTQLENFNYPHEGNKLEESMQLAEHIFAYAPDVITIMDHKPHPYHLLQALKNIYEKRPKPKIIIHLFGDFTINYNLWERCAPILSGFKVEFLVASLRQKILVDRMFIKNKSIVCPFPVDPNEFHPDDELRKQQRLEWKVKENDMVFLFTGRLSRQKRIKTLITQFAEEFKDEPRAHLYLYGNSDNIGDPFLGIFDLEGEYFRSFFSVYRSFSSELQSRIHFMGAVSNAELKKVYLGADVLLNLSVHNDEDFGMSVAEAQFSGLPSILTDWGGLAGFEHSDIPEATAYIPVKIGERSKLISKSAIRSNLRHYFNHPLKHLRKEISNASNEKFGLKPVSQIIQKSLSSESPNFDGYSELFYRASRMQRVAQHDKMYVTRFYKINQLFREIYSAYVR